MTLSQGSGSDRLNISIHHDCEQYFNESANAENHLKYHLAPPFGSFPSVIGRPGSPWLLFVSDHFFCGGGTWVSHQSNLVEPRRMPVVGTSVFSLTLTPE